MKPHEVDILVDYLTKPFKPLLAPSPSPSTPKGSKGDANISISSLLMVEFAPVNQQLGFLNMMHELLARLAASLSRTSISNCVKIAVLLGLKAQETRRNRLEGTN